MIEIKDLYGSIISKTYDANNSVTSEIDANGNITKYAYDSMGNLEKVQNASDQVMSYKFDGNYNIIEKQIGEKTATYHYDQANRKIKENNEYGYEESYTYDAYGNLIKASENGKHIQFNYDTYGNIISTKDIKGRETKYTYDVYGNQTSIQYHDKTKVTYTYNEFHKKDTVKENDQLVAMYSYDKLGNEISNIRNNVVTKTSYDKLGRKTNIETSKGNEQVSSYAYTYDGTNNITSEIIDGLENTYTYNELNELLKSSKYDEEGNIVKTTYGYDIYGNQIERKNNDEVKVYEYDDNNKLTKIKDEDGITHIKYNKNGNINKIFYGNGEKENFTYDAYDQLEKIEREDGTTFTYGYDPQGDRINYKKVKDDPLHQNSWYAYLEDENDEKRGFDDVKEQSETSFDTFKQKLDNADIYKCTFDEAYFNTDWYQTDAEQVIDKTTEHSQVLWQEGEGNQIYGNERLYSKGEQAKTTTYVYGLNNSVYATISNINDKDYIQKNKYDDYGQKPGIGNGYGYNGEFRDESELIYLRARYYNPKIARFIQIDSFKGDVESIQSQNRYVYTQNNPYKYTDPSGNNVFDRFIENLKKLNEQKEKNKVSLVEDAEYERKRDTRVKNGTWKSPYPYQKKPGPYNYIRAFYEKAPCPPVSNKIADGVRGFLGWCDDNLGSMVRAFGWVAVGIGALSLISAAVALSVTTLGFTIAGLSVSTFAYSLVPITLGAANITLAGSMIQMGSGILGYKLDGKRLSQEEAKQRFSDGAFNFGLAFAATTSATAAMGLIYYTKINANNPNSGGAGRFITSDNVIFKSSSIDKAFEKHRQDFGIYPDGSNSSIKLFEQDIKNLINTGIQKDGTWYGNQGTHIYNASTRQWVFINADGTFNTAFKLSAEQYNYLIETGVVR